MAVNEVIYGGKTVLSTKDTTVTADTLSEGVTAVDSSGATITGTNTNNADTTGTTVTAETLSAGTTAVDASGTTITGTNTADADTSDATATAADILYGKTAYARSYKLTGTIPMISGKANELKNVDSKYTIEQGYHDGTGTVKIASSERAKIVSDNIKSGVTILGVTGSFSGEKATAQAKSVTPSASVQTITPDVGYDFLSTVSVDAIPYVETENSGGGKTLSIG